MGPYQSQKVSKRLAAIVKTGREIKGLSQQKLAWLAGVHRRAVEDIEKKEVSDPRFSTIVKLSKAIGLSPEDFVKKLLD